MREYKIEISMAVAQYRYDADMTVDLIIVWMIYDIIDVSFVYRTYSCDHCNMILEYSTVQIRFSFHD